MTISKRVSCEIDQVTFWYHTLWRHKTSLYFYEFYNDFVSFFKGILFGKNTLRIFDQANKFLEKKGTIEQMENHSVIRIFCSKENPSFVPYHVFDKFFITKVARQYNFWLHFFHEKRKKQFIPLSWKIGYFIFINTNKIDELSIHFNNVSLKCVEKIKGFDPNKIFVEHVFSVGFSNSFIQTTLNEEEEEGNNQSTPIHEDGDLETILSTNEVQEPRLILNSMFLTKKQFYEQVEIFKGLSVENFYGILEYNEDEIDNW
jgi:hypothetical protein